MSTFWLKVIASDHVFYDGSCEALVVPAHDGEVGILPHREAMILASQEGELRFRIPGETDWHRAVVGLGIVQQPCDRCSGYGRAPRGHRSGAGAPGSGAGKGTAPSEAEHPGVPYVQGLHGESPEQIKSEPAEGQPL